MMRKYLMLLILLTVLLSVMGCSSSGERALKCAADYTPDETVNVILDTDIDTDVDDVGALAVLYSYVQEGRANVLATVGSCNSGYVASCLEGINSYYGFPGVPVGVSEKCPSSGKSSYQKILATIYSKDNVDDEARTALDVYRETLSKANDGSVVIIVLGPLNNLYEVLQSESDEYSSLSGRELVERKVKLCAIMGGCFIPEAYDGWSVREEYNVRLDVDAAEYVARLCPVPILRSGWEIGSSILTGDTRNSMEDDSPVRLAYNLYGKDASGSFKRQSWDLATVVCAVEGINGYWNAKSGTALVNTEAKLVDTAEPPGYTAWFSDGNGKDAVLAQKESPEELAEMLNSRMIQAKKGPALRSAEEISISDAIFVLYQLAGEPLGEVSNDDLLPEKWAAERLFKEVDKNILSVDAEITYGCLSMILYQYALLSGSQMEHSTVEEEKNGISGRWQDDLDWAISEGLIINEEITADTPVCREQFAEILIRYCYIVFSEN